MHSVEITITDFNTVAGALANPNTQTSDANPRKTRHINHPARHFGSTCSSLVHFSHTVYKSSKNREVPTFGRGEGRGGESFQMFIFMKQEMQILLYSK